MASVEEKIDNFGLEMRKLKEENADLKSLQADLKRELEAALDERDQQKKEQKNLKQINRALEKEIRDV